jgi:hypothetical protein
VPSEIWLEIESGVVSGVIQTSNRRCSNTG